MRIQYKESIIYLLIYETSYEEIVVGCLYTTVCDLILFSSSKLSPYSDILRLKIDYHLDLNFRSRTR